MPSGGAYGQGGAQGHVPNGRGLGCSGSPGGGYGQQGRSAQGWQAYNRTPQAIGRPQQPQRYGGAQSFGQGRQGYSYSAPQHVYGGNYGRQYGSGSSGTYNSRPSFGGNQQFRSPSSGYGYSGHSFAGSSGISRAPSSSRGGFFGGGGHSSSGYSFGGGSPRAPSYSSRSWGGGGGGSHFSSGGGHTNDRNRSKGSSHFS